MTDLSQYDNTWKRYGKCPICGDNCQPDLVTADPLVEYAVCCDCQIWWHIHPDDKKFGVNGDVYRITDVASFADDIVTPYECKERK